jgi:glycosyltransferase involved in cell wall biosynthesis
MTNRIPRVSVCIPTINRPHLLREAIASVAAQTFTDFEIVIGDNSGDGEGQRRIDAVLGQFPSYEFKVIRHPHQLDAAASFNGLIDGSEGELWACLPDDDRFCPTFLERSVGALDKHPECAFTFSDHAIMDVNGIVSESQSQEISIQFGRSLLHEGVYRHSELFEIVMRQSLCLQAALFRRPAIRSLKFAPGILALDQSLFLRLSTGQNSFNGYYVDQKLMEYRLHLGQISYTTPRGDFLRTTIDALESVGDLPPSHLKRFNAKLARIYLALAISDAERGQRASARANALRSLKLSPSLLAALGMLLVVAAPGAIPPIRQILQRVRSSLRA